jgi:hypothetical protein
MKTFDEGTKVIEESIKLNREYTTFKEILHKDLISNNDVVKLLEEVGFNEIKNDEDIGYLIKYNRVYYGVEPRIQDIEVYLKKGYLNIHLTPAYINLDIYKQEGPTFYYHGTVNHYRSWYRVKSMKYKKEKGIENFRNFLLLSICRDSFLDPEEEDVYRYGNNMNVDEFRIRENDDWHNWYL